MIIHGTGCHAQGESHLHDHNAATSSSAEAEPSQTPSRTVLVKSSLVGRAGASLPGYVGAGLALPRAQQAAPLQPPCPILPRAQQAAPLLTIAQL